MKYTYISPVTKGSHSVAWSDDIVSSAGLQETENGQTYTVPKPDDNTGGQCPVLEHGMDEAMPAALTDYVKAKKGNKCCIKDCPHGGPIEVDHRRPRTKGGQTTWLNLFPMCETHNSSKLDLDFRTWMKDNGLTSCC